ncbi:MAG TPA: hypothetical protein VK889_02715 [Solirubrobacterales bacterium]|nr:hypothetical protein [Solirubrobacterales bacterium]
MFLVAVVACSALVPVAHAKPLPPLLTGTTPASPGTLTTLRVLGRESGVGTSGIGTSVASRAFSPVGTSVVDEESPVSIYTDPACEPGSLVTTGDLGELETIGIEVTVAPDSITTFYATLTDQAEPGAPSDCSAGIAYRHVTGPPPPPAVTGVSPASPADDNAPRVSGTAESEATVAIYGDAACAGPVLAAGSGAALSGAGIAVPVADNTTTTFYAAASWSGMGSGCSESSVTYQELTVAPPAEPPGEEPPASGAPGGVVPSAPVPIPGRPAPPKLHTEPGGRANNATPRVAGSAPGAALVAIFASESCGGAPVATGSPAELRGGLSVQVGENSATAFTGVSVAADGDRSRCTPDPVLYVEDSLPPLTKITFGPGAKTRKRSAVFRFADLTGDPPGTIFLCKLDRRSWRACQSPLKLKRLRPRKHTLRIRGIDAAGNAEPIAAKRRFKVVPRRRR